MAGEVGPDAGLRAIDAAAARLRDGGLVAFPTETVYGLGADALREDAVERVFALKGRPRGNPLIVHVADAAMARGVVLDWPDEATAVAEALWPGPVTMVLPRAEVVPGIVAGGGPTVAVRSPDHPVAMALLEAFGGPIVGPSANRSGMVSPTLAEHVRGVWSEDEVMVLDGGACRAGIESTVVLLGDEPRVLRPGVVSAATLAGVLGRAVSEGPVDVGSMRVDAALPSPGLLERHYAPRTRAVLAGDVDAALAGAEHAVVLAIGWAAAVGAGASGGDAEVIRMPTSAAEYAARLYAALHEADEAGADLIVVERPEATGPEATIWHAVLERLGRACGG